MPNPQANVNNKDFPYSILREKTALIIIDMQYGFLEEGAPLECKYPGWGVVVPNHKKLIAFFREHNMPIIWVAFNITHDTRTLWWTFFPEIMAPPNEYFAPNKHYTEIIKEIAPTIGERVIWKHGYDAFIGTDLELMLRTLGVEYTVMTGLATNFCVSSSVRGAWHRQFKPVVISDACASKTKQLHETELEVFSIGWAKVMTTDEFIVEASKAPFPKKA